MRTLLTLLPLPLLAACGDIPEGYSADCTTSATCADGLDCLDTPLETEDTAEPDGTVWMCTLACEVDEDCPRAWTAHCGWEQALCDGGVCQDFTCK
jgi:hypothetical protein